MATQDSKLPIQWQWEQQTAESIEKHAQWLEEDRQLGSGCDYYFNMAGKLLRLSIGDYFLIVPAFYQTVIGLERALRIHYKAQNEHYSSSSVGNQDSFANLLQRAVDEGIINDDLFSESALIRDGLKKQIQEGRTLFKTGESSTSCLSYSQQLAMRIPALRNDHFHGANGGSFTLGILEVALDLRIIADNLKTKGVRSLIH